MTESETIRELREEISTLNRGIYRTFEMLCSKERECVELKYVNANLLVELQATDYVVGEAMDAALEGERA
jgi:hypothetical protein